MSEIRRCAGLTKSATSPDRGYPGEEERAPVSGGGMSLARTQKSLFFASRLQLDISFSAQISSCHPRHPPRQTALHYGARPSWTCVMSEAVLPSPTALRQGHARQGWRCDSEVWSALLFALVGTHDKNCQEVLQGTTAGHRGSDASCTGDAHPLPLPCTRCTTWTWGDGLMTTRL